MLISKAMSMWWAVFSLAKGLAFSFSFPLALPLLPLSLSSAWLRVDRAEITLIFSIKSMAIFHVHGALINAFWLCYMYYTYTCVCIPKILIVNQVSEHGNASLRVGSDTILKFYHLHCTISECYWANIMFFGKKKFLNHKNILKVTFPNCRAIFLRKRKGRNFFPPESPLIRFWMMGQGS